MIFYFSGTGNSQFIARKIATRLSDEIVSINKCLKENINKVYSSNKPIVIVCPTYAWRIPKIVENWIISNDFKINKDIYFIMTCGGSVGAANKYLIKLANHKNLNYKGLFSIVMPENYLALFTTPDRDTCQKQIDEALMGIDDIVHIIDQKELVINNSTKLADRIQSGPINKLFYPLIVSDKGFRVTDKCVACKKCESICPLNNIKIIDAKPKWLGNCTHCMACIACCPTTAIEYKNKSIGKHRHFIMED